MLGKWTGVSGTIWALILGTVVSATGYVPGNILKHANSSGIFNVAVFATIIPSLANIKAGDEAAADMTFWEPSTWPKECRGVGFCEAPRGALGHWCVIKDERIANWQAIVPTTWNASPRSPDGQKGAFEQSLIGTPVADPHQPLEIIRTIHSFDPCLACATHLLDPDGEELCKVQVR